MKNTSDVFAPVSKSKLLDDGYKFQIPHFQIEGDLAKAAARAQEKLGLRRHAFLVECVKFALAHMPSE